MVFCLYLIVVKPDSGLVVHGMLVVGKRAPCKMKVIDYRGGIN